MHKGISDLLHVNDKKVYLSSIDNLSRDEYIIFWHF